MAFLTQDENCRIENGLQCPECWGPNTHCRYRLLTKDSDPVKYECDDCGCNWSKKYFVAKVTAGVKS
jgi:uncharacterized Zn finger protein